MNGAGWVEKDKLCLAGQFHILRKYDLHENVGHTDLIHKIRV
jgi:hypothetical protein